jgi:hypothetical protein
MISNATPGSDLHYRSLPQDCPVQKKKKPFKPKNTDIKRGSRIIIKAEFGGGGGNCAEFCYARHITGN